jgi:N-ethylmaleimide reductase
VVERPADAWKKVVDRVHGAGGARIYLQLCHRGRQTHPSHYPSTNRVVAPSAIAIPEGQVTTVHGEKVDSVTPHALTVDEIQATVQDYVAAAKLAAKAGFDGIEVHGANGI